MSEEIAAALTKVAESNEKVAQAVKEVGIAKDLETRVALIEAANTRNESDHKEIKELFNQMFDKFDTFNKALGNRLPLWATIGLPVFVGVAVYLITRR